MKQTNRFVRARMRKINRCSRQFGARARKRILRKSKCLVLWKGLEVIYHENRPENYDNIRRTSRASTVVNEISKRI